MDDDGNRHDHASSRRGQSEPIDAQNVSNGNGFANNADQLFGRPEGQAMEVDEGHQSVVVLGQATQLAATNDTTASGKPLLDRSVSMPVQLQTDAEPLSAELDPDRTISRLATPVSANDVQPAMAPSTPQPRTVIRLSVSSASGSNTPAGFKPSVVSGAAPAPAATAQAPTIPKVTINFGALKQQAAAAAAAQAQSHAHVQAHAHAPSPAQVQTQAYSHTQRQAQVQVPLPTPLIASNPMKLLNKSLASHPIESQSTQSSTVPDHLAKRQAMDQLEEETRCRRYKMATDIVSQHNAMLTRMRDEAQIYADEDCTVQFVPSRMGRGPCLPYHENGSGVIFRLPHEPWTRIEDVKDQVGTLLSYSLSEPFERRGDPKLQALATERVRASFKKDELYKQPLSSTLNQSHVKFTTQVIEKGRQKIVSHVMQPTTFSGPITSTVVYGDLIAMRSPLMREMLLEKHQKELVLKRKNKLSAKADVNAKVPTKVQAYTLKDLQRLPDGVRQRPYYCHICGRTYRNHGGLQYHYINHQHTEEELSKIEEHPEIWPPPVDQRPMFVERERAKKPSGKSKGGKGGPTIAEPTASAVVSAVPSTVTSPRADSMDAEEDGGVH